MEEDAWAEAAAGWDEDADVRDFADKAFRVVEEKALPLLAGDRVLDVGCGTGLLSRKLAARGLRVVALDPSQAMVDVCRAKCGDAAIQVVRGVVDEAFVSENRNAFDLAVASSVCAFVPDYRALLRHVRAVAKVFVQFDFQASSSSNHHDDDEATAPSEGGFTLAAIEDGLRSAALQPVFAGPVFDVRADDTSTGVVLAAVAR